MQVFFDLFSGKQSIIDEFAIKSEELDGLDIIYAAYEYFPYEGDAHVIFSKENKLFEVVGSHCSCNGLEYQWKPEETTLNALLARPNVSEQAKRNLKEYFSIE